jgi:hypothetical protein
VLRSSSVLMVRPARFMANPQTMASNAFQRLAPESVDPQAAAELEFDRYVAELRRAGVRVLVVQDQVEPHTPDSIFPNNWVTFHEDGTVILYPMEAPNRRLERKAEVLRAVEEAFVVRRRIDLSPIEATGRYLEGTGSMVLDRTHRLAYICRSSRSHPDVVRTFTDLTGYTAVWFSGTDAMRQPIYHTNVMMAVGQRLAILCLEAVEDPWERATLMNHLRQTGKELLLISRQQMSAFAGNMLELRGHQGAPLFALSRQAWTSLRPEQQVLLRSHGTPIIAPIDTIERCGGGGTRCMVAEIQLPERISLEGLKIG